MNIMKINMLSMDDKIAKEKAANSAVSMPIMATVQSQSGMNALAFQGLKYLMEDPRLAQEVGVMKDDAEGNKDTSAKSYVAPFSSNIAFKGGIATKAAKTLAVLAGTAALVGCEKNYYDMPPAETKTEITVTITNEQTNALLTSMLGVLQQLLAQQQITQAQYDAYWQQMMNWQGQVTNDMSAMKALLTTMATHIISIDDKMDIANLKLDDLNAYQQIIITMLEARGYTENEALSILKQAFQWAKDHGNDVMGALQQIMAKLDLVNENLETLTNVVIDARDKAAQDRAALYEVALQIRDQGNASLYQQQIMIAQNGALIMQNYEIINGQKTIVKSIKDANIATNATIYQVAAGIGMKVDNLAAVIVRTGKSLEDVMKMSKEEIIAVLEANNEELQEVNNNLENLDSDVVKAAEQILAALAKISEQLDALSKQFADAVKMFKGKLENLTNIAAGIYANGVFSNMQLQNLNRQVFDLGKDVKSLKVTAIQISNDLKNGINIDTSKLEDLLKTLDLSVNASKDEIIAKLDEFIAGQEKLEIAINKLGDENNSKLDAIAVLIQNVTVDNSGVIDAINNLANANEENITAATEALAAKIDALIAKVDAVLGKLDNVIKVMKQYGDQILGKFDDSEAILKQIKENGDSLKILAKINNMRLAELKAEQEKVVPWLKDLSTKATTANTYLQLIEKRIPEIQAQIANLEAIAGKALTKEQLEELWVKHDSVGFAKAKEFMTALHIEDMAKADEIIANMKEGNQINKNTYDFLINYAAEHANDAEKLKAWLEAIYKYLPELKCNCNCNGNCNDSTHEGIIGNLI